MKLLDVFLQHQRYKKVDKFVTPGAKVLDIGCFDGSFLERHLGKASHLVGVDPHIERPGPIDDRIQLIQGLSDNIPEPDEFDLVTSMAVLEHLSNDESAALARKLLNLTTPDARFVVTVPSPIVDQILEFLIRLRLLDGMDTEAHHGQSIDELKSVFESTGWQVESHRKFQLGLNNLIVFRPKP